MNLGKFNIAQNNKTVFTDLLAWPSIDNKVLHTRQP